MATDLFLGATGGPASLGHPEFPANPCFDGDGTTWGWVQGGSTTAAWDTGAPVTINRIHLKWAYGTNPSGGGAAGPFLIQGSALLAGPYTTVVTDADPVTHWGASYPGDFEGDYPLGSPVTYQYWRMSSTDPGSNNDVRTIEGFGAGGSGTIIDVHDPGLVLIGTIDDAEKWEIRPEHNATGQGRFTLNRNSPNADPAVLAQGNVCKVTIPRISPDPIFTFLLEAGDFNLIHKDEEGGETIEFWGRGALAYLERGLVWYESLVNPGSGTPPGGVITVASTGKKPGQLLRRHIAECQHASRPDDPYSLLTIDFDYSNDSDGNLWNDAENHDELLGNVGDDGLTLLGRYLTSGQMDVYMDPDFGLHAYNDFGRDLTSTTFALDKVRFVRGVNIEDRLLRKVGLTVPANLAIVQGTDDVYEIATLALTTPDVEVFVPTYGVDSTALESIGASELVERTRKNESVSFPVAIGLTGTEDELTGKYLPGPEGTNGHFWVGDYVTVHTGSDPFDFNNVSRRVVAITITEDDGGNLMAIPELGGTVQTARLPPHTGTRGAPSGNVNVTPAPPATGTASATLATNAHANDPTDAHDATAISVLDTGAYFAGTNVETVLAELAGMSGGALTVKDEGSTLATTATTLDFVGAGVTASGTGATKTITVSGGAGSSAASGARVRNTTAINLTNGSITYLTYDTERWDDAAYHDTGSNTGRLTVPATGRFEVGGHVQITASGGTVCYLVIRVSGSTIIAVQNMDLAAVERYGSISSVWDCTGGTEYFELGVFIDASSKQALVASAFSPEFWIERTGDT